MPLYVIDGVERNASQFTAMDPSEIESITILKTQLQRLFMVQKVPTALFWSLKRGLEGKTSIL